MIGVHPRPLATIPLDDPGRLLQELRDVRTAAEAQAGESLGRWHPLIRRQEFLPSARNLAWHLALATHDLEAIRRGLVPWGLAVGMAPGAVLANLGSVLATLEAVTHSSSLFPDRPSLETYQQAEKRLVDATSAVFGPAARFRPTRVVATVDRAALDGFRMESLLLSGADCIRIRCAEDDPEIWSALTSRLRAAIAATDQRARLCFQLVGQRPHLIRTFTAAQRARLRPGDRLLLSTDPPGRKNGLLFAARCSSPDALSRLAVPARVTLGEGRASGFVERADGVTAVIRITHAPAKGLALRSGLSLGFPGTSLALPPLTTRDLDDLRVVLPLADLIEVGGLDTPSQVEALLEAMGPDQGRAPGLVLGIRSAAAVRNLPEMLVRAAGRRPVAVLPANELELGGSRLRQMRDEVIQVCAAAHVPLASAPDAISRLVRKGSSTRAEVAAAVRSESVQALVLESGPYLGESVAMLDSLLSTSVETTP